VSKISQKCWGLQASVPHSRSSTVTSG